jgi:hypothetical protein
MEAGEMEFEAKRLMKMTTAGISEHLLWGRPCLPWVLHALPHLIFTIFIPFSQTHELRFCMSKKQN